MWFYHREKGPKDEDGMTNSEDSDKTAPGLPRLVCPETL